MTEKRWLYFALGVTTVISIGAVTNQLVPLAPLPNTIETDGTIQADGFVYSGQGVGTLGQVEAPLSPNWLQEPVLDDSFVTTVEEERARHPNSSASAASPELQVNGVPVLLAREPLVIHASAFVSDGFDPDSHYLTFGGGYVEGTGAHYGCIAAQANLPSGVTLGEMFVSVYDNSGSSDLAVILRRVDNFDGTHTRMATASTSGTFDGIQVSSDLTISVPFIVYPDYSYYVSTCLLDSNTRLYSVRLYWE